LTLNSVSPPTRETTPVSSTRSRRTCSSTGISLISSRKSVPLSARSKKPLWVRAAPVKLPRSCPNSSLSIRLGDTAAQLSATNGPFRRRLSWCSVCATSSFPVPLSPCTSTVASVGATRKIMSYTACMAGEAPIRGPK
jgi:hypothetical protein